MYEKWQEKRVLFLFSIILMSVGWFVTGQFLLERKEKKVSRVSVTVLREQCAQEMGDIIQIIPAIMHGLANTQSAILAHICAFFDGEKQCFLLSAKKDQLADLPSKLIACKQQLAAIEQILQEQALFLQSLDSKKSKNNKSTKNNE